MNAGVIWQRNTSKIVIDFCKCDRIIFNDPLCRFELCDDCKAQVSREREADRQARL
jgi:hypothetical protein